MPRHVFLSPHLDDAVLSCGGTIHHLARQNEPVIIHNVMAGDPPNPLPDTPLVRELHIRWETDESPSQVRRTEDEAAAAVLGASTAFMNIPDCVYRSANGVPLYPIGDDDLFGDVAPNDPAAAILHETPLPDADYLYVPIGMGNHVDHQLVREWVLAKLASAEMQHAVSLRNVWFYEEYPYAEDERKAVQTLHSPVIASLKLQPVQKRLSHADFEAKFTALTKYRSQISTFWDDLDTMRSKLLEFMLKTGNGELSERYWRASSSGT